MRLGDLDALKEELHNFFDGKVIDEPAYILRDVFCHIDNATTVPLPDFKDGYKQAIIDGKTNFSRPQGEWEYVQYDGNANIGNWRCSECGRIVFDHINYLYRSYSKKPYYNFCPNCGADMRGAE